MFIFIVLRENQLLTFYYYLHFIQPAGFNKGKISLALLWIASTQKLEMRLGEAHSLKSPHGVDGKGKPSKYIQNALIRVYIQVLYKEVAKPPTNI